MISFKNITKIYFLILIIGLASCSSSKKEILYMQNARYGQPEIIENLNEIRVQPQDKVSIVVSCKEPELASLFNLVSAQRTIGSKGGSGSSGASGISAYTVDNYGDINFPVLGRIKIAGLTRQEISDKIADMLIKGDWVSDPVVTVEFANLHFTALGEVGSPGTHSIDNDRITLLEAISIAGDLTIYGNRNITVIREEDGKRTKYLVDLKDDNLFNSPVFYIKQNDVIYVEPNGVKAGQASVNENPLKSVSMWMSIATFLMSVGLIIFK